MTENALLPEAGGQGPHARRMVANVLAACLAVAGCLAAGTVRRAELLSPARLIDASEALREYGQAVTTSALGLLGPQEGRGGGEGIRSWSFNGSTFTVEDSRGVFDHFTFPSAPEYVESILTVTALMVTGAVIASFAWPVGRLAKAILILLAAVLPCIIYPLIDGAFRANSIRSWVENPEAVGTGYGAGRRIGLFLTVLIVTAAWRIARAIGAKDRSSADSAAEGIIKLRPPLMWAAAAAVCVVFLFGLPRLGLHDAAVNRVPQLSLEDAPGESYVVAILFCLAAVMMALVLAGRKWAGRLVWVPLAAAGVLSGGLLLSVAFVVVVLALNDRRTAAAVGKPVSKSAAASIRRRAVRPLTPIAWTLIGLAVLPVLGRTGLRLGFHLPFGDWPRLILAAGAAVTGGALAAWECASLVRYGRKGLAGPATVGVVLAVICIAASIYLMRT